MTERSYFQDGVTKGDAVLAPYAASSFSRILSLIYGQGSWVVPDMSLSNLDLRVTAPGGTKTVVVSGGKALVAGVIYWNSANVTLTIPDNTSGRPRIDRIIVRVDWAAQTARLAVISGAPDLTPEPPPLRQSFTTVYEMSIARLYLPNGFAATATNDIIDEKEYLNTADHDNAWGVYNYMHNGEFMSVSATDPTDVCPDLWRYSGGPTVTLKEKFSRMTRGRTVYVVAPSVNVGLVTTGLLTESATSQPFVLRALIHVIQGSVNFIFGGTTCNLYPTKEEVEILIRPRNLGTLTMSVVAASNNTIFRLGQITVSQGFVGAPYAPKSEFIPFNRAIPASNYAGGGKSSGTTTVSSAEWVVDSSDTEMWNYALMTGAKGALLKVGGYDSASAATAAVTISVRDFLGGASNITLELGNEVNNAYREVIGFLSLEDNVRFSLNAFKFSLVLTASGAGALHPTLELIGIFV